ncbi:MAG: hypothetical protein OXF11_22220 [Deltaproteobacteria bacterium]|nr:hypothetical protein [Deltaproteobacteria bacterium]
MSFVATAVATHFKFSVTGETVFFFRVWPFPSSRAGYVVTSDEDVRTLESRLETYYRWVVWAPALGAPLIAGLLVRGGIVEDDLAEGVVLAVVTALVAGAVAGLLFMKFGVDPIVRKYQTAHPMMEYVDTEEAPTGWRRLGGAAAVLGVLAYGLWLLSTGDKISGFVMLAVAVTLFVRVMREQQARSRRGGMGHHRMDS